MKNYTLVQIQGISRILGGSETLDSASKEIKVDFYPITPRRLFTRAQIYLARHAHPAAVLKTPGRLGMRAQHKVSSPDRP